MKRLFFILLFTISGVTAQTISFNDGINEVYYNSETLTFIKGTDKPQTEKIDSVQIYLSLSTGFSYIHTQSSVFYLNGYGIQRYSVSRILGHSEYNLDFIISKESNGDYWAPFVEEIQIMRPWPPYDWEETIGPKQKHVRVTRILWDN